MRILAVLPLLAFVGCTGLVPCSFVEGSRAFSDRALPDYRRYLEADAELDSDALEARLELLAKWERALADAETACSSQAEVTP